MAKFRTKSAAFEAIQFNGSNFDEVDEWYRLRGVTTSFKADLKANTLTVDASGSDKIVNAGDYVKFEGGVMDVIAKTTFESTYESA